MTKRKNTGLVRYSTRNYTKKTQKFQEGGFAAVSQAYDWRDDPYELMLLDHKSKEANSRIRANRGSSTGKNPKIGGIKSLTGGLAGATDAANVEFRSLYKNYTDQIKANGIAWVSSDDGQLMHQGIVNYGTELEYKLKLQKDGFDKAYGAIEHQDRQALAISAMGNIMVRERGNPTKVSKMSLTEYMGKIDILEGLTINQFADWKMKSGSMSTILEDEFLKNNAVDRGSIYNTFIKGHDESIQYAIEGDKIVKGTGSTKETQWLKPEFRKGIINILNDGTFDDAAQLGDGSQKSHIAAAVKSIFSEIMENNGTSDRSRLLASLQAEVLRDKVHLAAIMNMTNPEKRAEYLDTQVKLSLINKVVDKGSKKYSGGTEANIGSFDINNVRANGSKILSTILRFTDGTQTDVYSMGQRVLADGEERVVAFNTPMVKGGISSTALGLNYDAKMTDNERKQNIATLNTAIDKIAFTDASSIYTESGELVSKIAPSQFLSENSVITKGTEAKVVMIPFNDKGKMMVKEFGYMKELKLDIRRTFKQSMSKELKKVGLFHVPVNQLIPGSKDPEVQKAYNEYKMWVQLSADPSIIYDMYDAEVDKNGVASPETLSLKNQTVAATAIIQDTARKIKSKFGDVMMRPVLMVNVTFNNDDFDFKEAIESLAKTNNYGIGTVRDVTDPQKVFLEDTNKVNNNNFWFDRAYKTNIFMVLKRVIDIELEAGQKTAAAVKLGNIEEEVKKYINAGGILSNPNFKNAYMLAIN